MGAKRIHSGGVAGAVASVAVLCWFAAAGCGTVSVADLQEAQDDAGAVDALTDTTGIPDGVTVDSVSAGGECLTDFDCVGKVIGTTPCLLPACTKGVCGKKQRAAGETCQNPGEVVGECQRAVCDASGGCGLVDKAEGTACQGLACGKICKAGVCAIAPAETYDDGNPCTKDFCNQGLAVVHEPITDLTIECDDGDACTGVGACVKGTCAGEALKCTDGIDCTTDSCKPGSGCVHTPVDSACDDGDPCTKQGCDLSSGCTTTGSEAGATCDDGNTCTKDDVCDAQGGCAGTPTCVCTSDDDCKATNLCLGPLACVSGVCEVVAGKAVICDGKDDTACAQAQCVPASGTCASIPTQTGTPCDDGDACTSGSACQAGTCQGTALVDCDDNNPCTIDKCVKSTGCSHAPSSDPCEDGNPCTEKDACDKGGCKGVAKACEDGLACTLDSCDTKTGACAHAGQNGACDDKNPCTTDTCEAGKGCAHAANDAGTCSDGDACTVDACKAGVCTSTNTCPCKPETGAEDCNDNNPCTVDTCDLAAKKCKNDAVGANGQACDSGDKCQMPGTGSCKAGACVSGNKPVDCSSKSGPCATGVCLAATGKCAPSPKADGVGCDADGSVCTANDACKAGVCLAGPAVNCVDGNPCTQGTCDKLKGCVFAPLSSGSCDDGDACTGKDGCVAGVCKGTVVKCDDGNPCTTDSCAKTLGCQTVANTAACDDGNACTKGDVCSTGTCKPGAALNCDDSNPCTTDSCDKAKGCVNTVNALGCTDGNACTQGDVCSAGACKPGVAVNCDDGKLCTSDSCDKVKGCVHVANSVKCDDNNACTTVDVCSGGLCKGSSAMSCDDGKVCTTDSCDPTKGCLHVANTAACDDGNACTEGDSCVSGGCTPGKVVCACAPSTGSKDCDDGNPCTTDTCVPSGAKYVCSNAANTNACSDGNACTKGDVCSGGSCKPGAALSCVDGNVCTNDTCDATKGCQFPANAAACSDGNACTTGDVCSGGTCKPGVAVICNDNNVCTADSCSPTAGCTYTPSGGSCSDGNVCTVGDTCAKTGACVSGPVNSCNDGNVCTTDSCSPKFGCLHLQNTVSCNDGNACTTGDVCSGGVCKGPTAVKCNDGNPCTYDSCSVKTGCNYNASLMDGMACGALKCCNSGACVFGKLCMY